MRIIRSSLCRFFGILLAGNIIVCVNSAALAKNEVSKKKTGGHVILRVGKGYSRISAAKVAANLPEQCTHEITNDGMSDGELTVEVGDNFEFFKYSGEAGNVAERWCLESLKK